MYFHFISFTLIEILHVTKNCYLDVQFVQCVFCKCMYACMCVHIKNVCACAHGGVETTLPFDLHVLFTFYLEIVSVTYIGQDGSTTYSPVSVSPAPALELSTTILHHRNFVFSFIGKLFFHTIYSDEGFLFPFSS